MDIIKLAMPPQDFFPARALPTTAPITTMKHDEYSFLRFDDPPAPQDPPLLHNPLSPPRSRASFNPSSPGGSSRHSARNSTPLPQLYPHILSPKPKRSSEGDTSQPPENLRNWARHTISHSTLLPEEVQAHQEHLVTTDSSRSVALSSRDTDAFSPQVLPKYPSPSPAEDASTPQLGAHEFEQASFRRSAQNDLSINQENLLTGTNNITMQEPRSSSTTPDAPPIYGSSDCLSLGFLPLASSEDHSEGVGLTEQVEPDSGYSTHNNRDDTEGDTDWRSMISSVLNVYYRDPDGASIEEDHWSPTDDIDACATLEDTNAEPTTAPASENDLDDGLGSISYSPPLPETSPRRRKPVSLFLNTTSIWEEEGGLALRIMPQTAPAVRGSRPLPPLPNYLQRSIRPLPRPPVPPEYSPPPTSSSTPDIPSTAYSPAPLARALSLHTPCPSSSSSATCASSESYSNWPARHSPTVPRTAPKRPLPPLLAVSPCESEPASPLSPDIPIPPSPGTARRFQASKVSKILGEDITFEPPGLLESAPPLSRIPKRSQTSKLDRVLGDNIPVELPGLRIRSPPKPPSPKTAKQPQGSKVSRILGEDIPVKPPGLLSPGLLAPSSPNVARRPIGSKISRWPDEVSPELPSIQKSYIPAPPSPRTAKRFQASKASKILGEDVPPELVYGQSAPPPPPPAPVQLESPSRAIPAIWDMEVLRSRLRARQDRPQAVYLDNASEEFDADISEDAESQIEVETDHTVDEEENDQTNMSIYSMNASLSSGDFGDDDLDDTEEGRISWALQTVVTYETASRVKRTSRMWVLEKNGERKEEGNYANVLKALRQL